jgi:hypothetical protein
MVCFFQFCDVATLEIRPQEESAKFGYRSESKVENFKYPAIFWWPAETYCLNMVISERKKKIFYMCHTGFFLLPSGENLFMKKISLESTPFSIIF